MNFYLQEYSISKQFKSERKRLKHDVKMFETREKTPVFFKNKHFSNQVLFSQNK